MLHSRAFITAPDDFPGLRIDLRRPTVAEWGDYQGMHGAGNRDEGQLNLLISCGTIVCDDGIAKPANMGTLCDDWPSLPGEAYNEFATMAGTFGIGYGDTVALDLPSVLAAAERVQLQLAAAAGQAPLGTGPVVKPTDADIALASIAAQCATFGLDAQSMRNIIASHRPKQYRALLVPTIGAALVFRRPRFPVWSAFNRGRGSDSQAAGTDFAASCCEVPGPVAFRSLVETYPAVSASSAAICVELFGNVKAEVGKELQHSASPAETPSQVPPR